MPLMSGGKALAEVAHQLSYLSPVAFSSLRVNLYSCSQPVILLLIWFSKCSFSFDFKSNESCTNSIENGHSSFSLRQAPCSLIKKVCCYTDINTYMWVWTYGYAWSCQQSVQRAEEESALVNSSKTMLFSYLILSLGLSHHQDEISWSCLTSTGWE